MSDIAPHANRCEDCGTAVDDDRRKRCYQCAVTRAAVVRDRAARRPSVDTCDESGCPFCGTPRRWAHDTRLRFGCDHAPGCLVARARTAVRT